MNIIKIITLFIILSFSKSLFAEEVKCKTFDIGCKTKKFIDETKEFQKKGLEDGKSQVKKGFEGGKNKIKNLPEKLKKKN